jgi:hypothetical protein
MKQLPEGAVPPFKKLPPPKVKYPAKLFVFVVY